MLLQHGIATELKRLICLQKSLSEEILILAMNAVNNLLLSEMGQNAFTVSTCFQYVSLVRLYFGTPM